MVWYWVKIKNDDILLFHFPIQAAKKLLTDVDESEGATF